MTFPPFLTFIFIGNHHLNLKKILYIFLTLKNFRYSFYKVLMATEGGKFNDSNVYRVGRNSRVNEAVFLAKLVLKKHSSAQLEALGQSISLQFKIAQILSKNGYATIQSIKEENFEREGRREINPKVTIVLQKSKDFDKLTEGLTLREK